MRPLRAQESFLRSSYWASIITCLVTFVNAAHSSPGPQATNYWGGYTTSASTDITKPVPDRSYFTTQVEPHPRGAKVTAEFFHGKFDSNVSVILQIAIQDAKGQVLAIPVKVLDDHQKFAPASDGVYYNKREYIIDYKEINTELLKLVPTAAAKNIQVGPGSPMFLFAQFWDYNHQWGSLGRGGLFFLPENPGDAKRVARASGLRRVSDLDVAYPITRTMEFAYNDPTTGQGLKPYGQVRSRVEGEGKFQVPLNAVLGIKQKLFDLANDPILASQTLGPDWTIQAENRYMLKDANGKLILDKNGLPIPDPMIDTYYDNSKYDAARNDMAIRYRFTAGNGVGAWNFKPDGGYMSPEGISYRREYGVDATNDKPQTIQKFVDSMDPLNPFREIRTKIPGAIPSEFLKPSVEVVDVRHKFILKHRLGMALEVSVDEVTATDLRSRRAPVKYAQVEMDIDHMSTASQNVAGVPNNNFGFTENGGELDYTRKNFLAKLDANATVEGRPVLHIPEDVASNSPVRQRYKTDFDLATEVITKIREKTIGDKWLPAPQKYALAAEELGLVSKENASASVKRLRQEELRLGFRTEASSSGYFFNQKCAAIFN